MKITMEIYHPNNLDDIRTVTRDEDFNRIPEEREKLCFNEKTGEEFEISKVEIVNGKYVIKLIPFRIPNKSGDIDYYIKELEDRGWKEVTEDEKDVDGRKIYLP